MKKVELINPEKYFVESRKAVQVAIEKEQAFFNGLSKQDKLNLLKIRKEETRSDEEYDAIEASERQLEKEIKFDHPVPLVPDEYKEMVKRNLDVEESEASEELKKLRKELVNQLPYLQNVLLPLLINIGSLKGVMGISRGVEVILEHSLQESFREIHSGRAESLVRTLGGFGNKGNLVLVKDLQQIIKTIEKMKF